MGFIVHNPAYANEIAQLFASAVASRRMDYVYRSVRCMFGKCEHFDREKSPSFHGKFEDALYSHSGALPPSTFGYIHTMTHESASSLEMKFLILVQELNKNVREIKLEREFNLHQNARQNVVTFLPEFVF